MMLERKNLAPARGFKLAAYSRRIHRNLKARSIPILGFDDGLALASPKIGSISFSETQSDYGGFLCSRFLFNVTITQAIQPKIQATILCRLRHSAYHVAGGCGAGGDRSGTSGSQDKTGINEK